MRVLDRIRRDGLLHTVIKDSCITRCCITERHPIMPSSPSQPTTDSGSHTLDPSAYLIRTSSLPESSFQRRYHNIATDRFQDQVLLGAITGLTKTGIYLYRLPPGMTSMALHWHESTDEWMYILNGGEGAALLVWERGEEKSKEEIVPKEVVVKDGDFLGFRAGVERAHALKAGTTELVYLVGARGGRRTCAIIRWRGSGWTRLWMRRRARSSRRRRTKMSSR
ncbi:hypothetical protein C8Q80DRAFT_830207 [Daedaleopsis nitida]|nr:hypothetical protein C8Q80DRAFT_830207 [Daedaleopsis nitida]